METFLNLLTIVETIICFFSVWSIIGLAGFHTYLATSEQTTNEDVSDLLTPSFRYFSVNHWFTGISF